MNNGFGFLGKLKIYPIYIFLYFMYISYANCIIEIPFKPIKVQNIINIYHLTIPLCFLIKQN